jgi:hypothetical protein
VPLGGHGVGARDGGLTPYLPDLGGVADGNGDGRRDRRGEQCGDADDAQDEFGFRASPGGGLGQTTARNPCPEVATSRRHLG